MGLARTTTRLVDRALTTARVLGRAGVIRPYSPQVASRVALTLLTRGTSLAGGFVALAQRAPHRVALVDDLGELTVLELHRRSNALADSLAHWGVRPGDAVAILCRNHRGFVEASLAAAKLGADLLYLNTGFAAPQLADVLAREGAVLLVHDEEFGDVAAEVEVDRLVAWTDSAAPGVPTLERFIEEGSPDDLRPQRRTSRVVILTSGTTGAPKGAPRSSAGLEAAVALLASVPLRDGGRTHVAAPLFHSWGLAHWALSLLLGSTIVLRRRFDPETCLRVVEEQDCDALVVVPVMLQRILRLPEHVLDAADLSQLRVVAASGSALPGDLASEWMDRFGDRLYNVYGSTEVAIATVAAPEDLRAAPGTAGRPLWSTEVRILDEHGAELPPGESGRVFVGSGLLLEGYTGGGSKEVVDGRMATGDLGRLVGGRLFVAGRDDEMIVSGGENVFPLEVEDCLCRHPDVVEAAAVGVDDEEFGQRLLAFVVRRAGATVDDQALRAHVREELARFKVPREIRFLDELPRNATGKVLKRALADRG